jgi:hypothetical protein
LNFQTASVNVGKEETQQEILNYLKIPFLAEMEFHAKRKELSSFKHSK